MIVRPTVPGADRGWRFAVVAAAVVAVVAGCTAGGGERSTTSATVPPEAGARLDGARLPKPVSYLLESGGLVSYYAVGDGGQPELVAVDPSTAQVAWSRPATISQQPSGLAIEVDAVDGGVAILAPAEDGSDDTVVQVIDPMGDARWTQPLTDPERQPAACGDSVCVDTAQGLVSFDADDGTPTQAVGLPDGTQNVAAGGDASLSVVHGDSLQEPARAVLRLPRPGPGRKWSRPLVELFGDDRVTSEMGWDGLRYGEGWVLSLGHVSDLAEGEEPEFPYEPPRGSVAGFAVADGEPRWLRSGIEVCTELSSDVVLVLCPTVASYPSATEVGRLAHVVAGTGGPRHR